MYVEIWNVLNEARKGIIAMVDAARVSMAKFRKLFVGPRSGRVERQEIARGGGGVVGSLG